tara:strand:- start:721 stop:966 length:246 start_codon:yes stop_codon:yes gene_type:complete
MKRFLIILILVSFLIPKDIGEGEVGRYQLAVSTYVSKKGITYIVETVLDTKTGKVVIRRKKKASSYKLPYKNKSRKMIYQE